MSKHLLLTILLCSSISLLASSRGRLFYCVTALAKSQPGKAELLKEELLKLRNLSRQEPACITFEVTQSDSNENEFSVYEEWLSKKDQEEQPKKWYVQRLIKKLPGLLAQAHQKVVGTLLD